MKVKNFLVYKVSMFVNQKHFEWRKYLKKLLFNGHGWKQASMWEI